VTYQIGTWYYPGWKDGALGGQPFPWSRLSGYQDRTPSKGRYPDGEAWVMRAQLAEMASAGLAFVAFDWYHQTATGKPGTVQLNHALDAYLAAPRRLRDRVRFAINWVTHDGYDPATEAEFEACYEDWTAKYLGHEHYLRIDSRPVIFIFDYLYLKTNAAGTSLTGQNWSPTRSMAYCWNKANTHTQAAGFQRPFWVAGPSRPTPNSAVAYAADALDGVCPYQVATTWTGETPDEPYPTTYAGLDAACREHWDWNIANQTPAVILPIHAGWDRGPDGGSSAPNSDGKRPSIAEWRAHLLAAKARMDAAPAKTLLMGVLYAWNEIAEGGMIEPSWGCGRQMLAELRSVFGGQSKRFTTADLRRD